MIQLIMVWDWNVPRLMQKKKEKKKRKERNPQFGHCTTSGSFTCVGSHIPLTCVQTAAIWSETLCQRALRYFSDKNECILTWFSELNGV